MELKFSKLNPKRVSIKKLFVTLLVMLSTFTASQAAFSDEFSDDLTVTPMGIVNGEMAFTLKYNNVDGDKVEIILTDKEGERLYRKTSNDTSLNTTFKLPSDIETVYLTVTNTKDNTQKKFQISSRQRVVDKLIIVSVQ